MTMAAGEGGTDAENGVTMTGRDQFAGTPGSTGPGQEPDALAGTADSASPDAGEPQDTRLEAYGDSAYGRGEARAAYRDAGHDTVIKPGPPRPAVPGGFTVGDFTINEQAGTVTCPAGLTRPMTRTRTITFGARSSGSSPGPPSRTAAGSGSATSAPPRTTPGCTPGAPRSTCAPCSGTG
jgi:hypothetical protein